MNHLLIEIGTEEIPAGYIEPALASLSALLLQKLDAARITHGKARIFGTPRRLGVEIADVADKQAALTEEITGPPEKVGFDSQGKPLVPALKFAEKLGISVSDIRIKDTEKGRYLCADKTEKAMDSKSVLANLLPEAILATAFPKTMRWADLKISFARPIRSVLAILGNEVIPFVLGGKIQSGKETFGHRFMKPQALTIQHSGEYAEKLRSAYVLADLQERRNLVEQEVSKVAADLGGSVLPDSELIDIVKNLVEYPVPVAGKFDKEFLEVPDEVLITAMREHQKYFAVIDANKKLMPCFIAVNNTRTKDMSLVAKGHERVLRARLSDAKFFFRSDLDASFDLWSEKLKGVLFQAKLGSMYEKTMRIRKLAEFLSDASGQDAAFRQQVSRAAELCKADLVSQVVVEFPKLQGVMGRIYAHKKGEAPAVAAAVEEHYRPTYSGGALPETLTGALLAIADKADSICGCFKVGLMPTGASDPYALRRQSIGIVQIMLDKNFSFSLTQVIEKSLSLFGEMSNAEKKEVAGNIYTFFKNRIAHKLVEDGFSKDVVAAVSDVSVDYVPQVWERVRALEKLKSASDFEPLAVAFKRVVNIIKKAAETGAGVQENLFEHECESALYAAYKDVKQKFSGNMDKGDFNQALLDMASLRPAVDAFFDGVMVMSEDERIRNNRLALLKQIADLFGRFADFSKI